MSLLAAAAARFAQSWLGECDGGEEELLGRVLAVRRRERRAALHLSPELLHQLGVALLHLLGQLLSGLIFENISIRMKLLTNRAEG